MTHRFRALLWDIDGTFVDSEPTHARALDDVMWSLGVRLSAEAHRRTVGVAAPDMHAMLKGYHPALPDFSAFFAAKTAAYLARKSEIVLRRGVREALAWLEAEGLVFGFVSNSDRVIVSANLQAAGIDLSRYVTVTCDDVRHGKPHPEPYLLAAHRLGVEPAACVVVEDSPTGATAGLAAGMTVIGWPCESETAPAFPAGSATADPHDLVSALAAAVRENKRLVAPRRHSP